MNKPKEVKLVKTIIKTMRAGLTGTYILWENGFLSWKELGDIDIFVHPDDAKKVWEICNLFGYETYEKDDHYDEYGHAMGVDGFKIKGEGLKTIHLHLTNKNATNFESLEVIDVLVGMLLRRRAKDIRFFEYFLENYGKISDSAKRKYKKCLKTFEYNLKLEKLD